MQFQDIMKTIILLGGLYMRLLFKNDDHQKFYYDTLSRLKDAPVY